MMQRINIENSLYSESNRVLLMHEDELRINSVDLFQIKVPQNFIEEKGSKSISINLVYNPSINNSKNYHDVNFEFHLFKDLQYNYIIKSNGEMETITNDDDEKANVPINLRRFEIILTPGINLRKEGVHQKGTKEFKRLKINQDIPLTLVIICQKKGQLDENFMQKYSVIVSFEHSKEIDLYNQIKLGNQMLLNEKSA